MTEQKQKTIREALRAAQAALAPVAAEEAAREARLFFCHAFGWDAARLLSRQNDVFPGECEKKLEAMLKRRLAGEPLQYILGEWELMGLPFAVDARALIPRQDTETLIETALGVENAFSIASASPRVQALFLGAEDLSADLHCKRTKEGTEILYARTRLVMAARAAGIDVYDTPFTDVDDDEGLCADAALAKSLGFTGKAAISPRHLGNINRCFSPTQAEVDHANEVLAALEEGKRQGRGAVALHGKMIDAPIAARAKRTLADAEQILKRGGTLA